MKKGRTRGRTGISRQVGILVRVLDPSAERRLQWLLEFSVRDLSKCTARQRRELEEHAASLSRRWAAKDAPVSAGDLEDGQDALRIFLTEIAHNRPFRCAVPGGAWEFCRVEDERRLPRSGTAPKPTARWPGRIVRSCHVPLPIALVQTAADLLDVIGAERLLPCPFKPNERGEPCSTLFLATRRQRYCGPDHSRKAAWLAWLQRQGGTRAKA